MAIAESFSSPAEDLVLVEFPSSIKVSSLAREFEYWTAQFSIQDEATRSVVLQQARLIAAALVKKPFRFHFHLPDEVRIATHSGNPGSTQLPVPVELRAVPVWRLQSWEALRDIRAAFCERLSRLSASPLPAVSAAAGLLQYAVANYLIEQVPLSGSALEVAQARDRLDSASLASWEVIDSHGQLIPGSLEEAEQRLAALGGFLQQLKSAVELAPFIVVDPAYQARRTALLKLLLEQGRKLAHFETLDIIRFIQNRNGSDRLNRGLHMHVPYFDDRSLQLKTIVIHAIPAGKVMFVPAFVVLACQHEKSRIKLDSRMSPTTQRYLLANLDLLESAFDKRSVN
jgi:hypothetical protein